MPQRSPLARHARYPRLGRPLNAHRLAHDSRTMTMPRTATAVSKSTTRPARLATVTGHESPCERNSCDHILCNQLCGGPGTVSGVSGGTTLGRFTEACGSLDDTCLKVVCPI